MTAILHDCDDRKYFPQSTVLGVGNTFANAKRVLTTAGVSHEDSARVIRWIGLVSASTNRDSAAPIGEPWWCLLPRLADRAEAIGAIGVLRCLEVTLKLGQPLFTSSTLRATTRSELAIVAPRSRYYTLSNVNLTMQI